MFSSQNLKDYTSSLLIELRKRGGFNDILKNFGWLFLDKAMRAFLGLIIGAWIARYLGPSQFGELAYYIALIAIFQTICTIGMDSIVVREIAKAPNRSNAILGTVFWMRLLAGFICWTCILLGFAIIEPDNKAGFWILAIVGASLLFQSGDVVDLWFQGKSQNKRGVYAKLTAYLIASAIKLALIILEAEFIAFAIVIAFEAGLVALAMFISYSVYPCKGRWISSWKLAKRLITESWPYMLSGISIMTYMRIDQIMIKEILGEYELGLFSAVLPFANIWNIIPVIICAVLLPYMTRIKMVSEKDFNKYLTYLFRFFWIVAIGLILFTNLCSEFLIEHIYGDLYLMAIPVLNIYIFTLIPVFLGVAQNIWIVNEGKASLLLIQTFLGAIASVGANLILLPAYGILGAAIAAVVAQCISAVLINLILSRKLFMMQLGFKI